MKRFLKSLLIGLLCLGVAGTAFSAPKMRMNPHTGKPDYYGVGLNDNNIDSIDNVAITSAANGDLLRYVSSTSKWTNVTLGSLLPGNVSGTTNQVNVTANSNSVGQNITLSLPQSIATSSTVSFVGMNLSGLAQANGILYNSSNAIVADAPALTATYLPLAGANGRLGNSSITQGVSGEILHGRVWNVPLGESIATAITNATAGDTIILDSGSYAVSAASITIDKALKILGNNSTINFSKNAVNAIDITASNVTIDRIILNHTGTGGLNGISAITNGLTGLIIKNSTITVGSGAIAGSKTGIQIADSSAIIDNCKLVVASSDLNATGVFAYTSTSAANPKSVTIYNSDILATAGSGGNGWGLRAYKSGAATNGMTINAYRTHVSAPAGTASYGFEVNGSTSVGYAENCYLNSYAAYDAYNTSGSSLTLANTVLQTNTTSGTITYAGTVATDKVSVTTNKDGGAFVNQAGTQFLVNDAKGKMINAVYSIVTPANVVLFNIFDRTGAVTALKDYATIGGTTAHTATLGGNASTLSPAISGMCPNLTMNGAAATAWTVNDAADLSFGAAGTDTAFSIVALINPTDMTSSFIVVKTNSAAQREYMLWCNSSDKLNFYMSNLGSADDIARNYNTALTTDEGTWHTYMGTASGGAPQLIAGLKVYRDGVKIDDTDATTGTYTGMSNGTSVVSNSSNNASNWSKAKYGVVLIVKEELTAVQAARLDAILRAYAGSDLN